MPPKKDDSTAPAASKKATTGVAKKGDTGPKGQKGAWRKFLKKEFPTYKDKYPDLTPQERMKKLAEAYKASLV
ncbi:hypothetical protein HK405_006684 [Cladochytrium tenue]|nr:hypothetical protein HK405_006684 [Cladochytrium tenue]